MRVPVGITVLLLLALQVAAAPAEYPPEETAQDESELKPPYMEPPIQPEDFELLGSAGLQLGGGSYEIRRTRYANKFVGSVTVGAGATFADFGDLVAAWRMASPAASNDDPPLCGDLATLDSQQLFDLSYRRRFNTQGRFMPFVQGGPVVGIALYTEFKQSGCGSPPPAARAAFTTGLTVGAGLAVRAGSLARILIGVDHLQAWSAFDAEDGTSWDRMYYTTGRLGLEFHF